MKIMKTNWTFALAAFCFILGSTPVEAKPPNANQSVQATYPNGVTTTSTGYRQATADVVIVTVYGSNGSVTGTHRIEKPRGR